MKIIIKDLLEYFDLKASTNYGDTTSAISVVGEDLCAAIFKNYCESVRNSKIDVIDPNLIIPTTLQRIGRRLDRWILEIRKEDGILYQTEIKNWCARAIGGIDIPSDVTQTDLDRFADYNWSKHIETLEQEVPNGLNKVLVNMVNDNYLKLEMNYRKEPLVIYWHACKPANTDSYFFKYKLKNKHFYYDYCWNFSCSLYLRDLLNQNVMEINLVMPNVERRLRQINQIFNLK